MIKKKSHVGEVLHCMCMRTLAVFHSYCCCCWRAGQSVAETAVNQPCSWPVRASLAAVPPSIYINQYRRHEWNNVCRQLVEQQQHHRRRSDALLFSASYPRDSAVTDGYRRWTVAVQACLVTAGHGTLIL